jgi:hypothetical protein
MVKMLKQEYLRMNTWPEGFVCICGEEFGRNIHHCERFHGLPNVVQKLGLVFRDHTAQGAV